MSSVERASATGGGAAASSSEEEEELTAEEAAAAAVEQMKALQASIGQLEQLLTPLLHTPLQSLNQQLPPVQAAKLQAALAYTTNALFLCQCNRRCASLRWTCGCALECCCSILIVTLCCAVSPAPLSFSLPPFQRRAD
jgi:hypothetical protein